MTAKARGKRPNRDARLYRQLLPPDVMSDFSEYWRQAHKDHPKPKGRFLNMLADVFEDLVSIAKKPNLANEQAMLVHKALVHLQNLRNGAESLPDDELVWTTLMTAIVLSGNVVLLKSSLEFAEAVTGVRARDSARIGNLAQATAADDFDRRRFRKLAVEFIAMKTRPSYASVRAYIVRKTGAKPGRVERLYPRQSFKSVQS